jgi:hypothetical protein
MRQAPSTWLPLVPILGVWDGPGYHDVESDGSMGEIRRIPADLADLADLAD